MKVEDGVVRHRYKLQAVLVHSGDMNAGHYFALIRTGSKWFRFDDDKVIPVTEREVMEENYGGSSICD
jgi:ubiquitin carboxyl-terminal hydrolase 7